MKSFTEILVESTKTYEFKIGVAGDLPEGFEAAMKTALEKYKPINVSAGKRTPITERPLDFPQLQNVNVTYFEAEVMYPTTPQVLQQYLGDCCSVPQSNIIVRNANDPREEYQAPVDETPYEAKLTTEDMGGESAQDSVAGNRVMDLLKELEVARKEREIDPIEATPKGESKDIKDSDNSKAVVGG